VTDRELRGRLDDPLAAARFGEAVRDAVAGLLDPAPSQS